MVQIGVTEAKKHIDNLVAAALAGEDVVITRYGKPVARVRPLTPDERREADEQLKSKD